MENLSQYTVIDIFFKIFGRRLGLANPNSNLVWKYGHLQRGKNKKNIKMLPKTSKFDQI